MPRLARSTCAPAKVDLNLTPLIDVVFQLLTFFLLTFQVATAEGDFELKLPRDLDDRGIVGTGDRLTIRLTARPDGNLAAVQVNGLPPLVGGDVYTRLHDEVVRLVHGSRNAGLPAPEVEIDAADRLRYEHVIQTVAAVSAQVDDLGAVQPLIRKIRFTRK